MVLYSLEPYLNHPQPDAIKGRLEYQAGAKINTREKNKK